MNKTLFLIIVAIFIFGASYAQEQKIPAFPEAEGFGAFSQGGRNGKIYLITTLEDYDENERIIPGSFREAVDAEGPRTIIFRVSGIISLKRQINIVNPYITIAGQTATGEGICIKDDQFKISTDEVIIRHMRFRTGDSKQDELDAVSVRGENIIFDHCSASWSIDENLTAYSNSITIQKCIISEGLYKSYHPKGIHSMGSILNGQYGGISLLYNIYAHNNSRNPVFQNTEVAPGAIFDMRNNVIYDWGKTASYVSGVSAVRVNMVGNYFKPGPSTAESARSKIFSPNAFTSLYISGNYHTENEEANHNNWLLVKSPKKAADIRERRKQAFPHPPISIKDGKEIYDYVLEEAGALLPERDKTDRRIVSEVRNGKGKIIDSQNEVGGWPDYEADRGPQDRDRDGMPDSWEIKNGLDPNKYEDQRMDTDQDGYTNIEEFLNGTDPSEATLANLKYSGYMKAMDELDNLNIKDYKIAEKREAERIDRLQNRPVQELNIQISGDPEDKQGEIELLIENEVRISLRFIPAGTFMMGSPKDEPGREDKEVLHKVTLTEPYYLAATELTNEQFSIIMGLQDEEKNKYPARISKFDAEWVCRTLSENTGYTFRLPTEAEWEYACRAGTRTMYFTGDTITTAHANFNTQEEGMEVGRKKVASTKPNPWGLYDMLGNVFEWCSDWEGPYPEGPVTDPKGPYTGSYADKPDSLKRNVIRGGNYSSSWKYIRSAYRYDYTPNVTFGMRLLMEVPEK